MWPLGVPTTPHVYLTACHITLCAFVTVIPFACLWNYVGSGVKDLLEIFEGGEKTAVTSLVPEELKVPIFAILIIFGAFVGMWVRKEYLLALRELEEIDLKKKTTKRAVFGGGDKKEKQG